MPVLKPVFGIFAVLGWVILLGLHTIWHYTFGWLFRTLADFVDDIGFSHLGLHFHPFHPVAAWLRSLDRNVDNALVRAANELEHAAVWLFSRVGHVFGWLASRVEALALGVEHAIRKLVRVTIPRLIGRLLKVVWKELRSIGRYARKMIPKLLRDVLRFSKWAVHEIAKGARHLGFLWKWIKDVIKLHWRAIMGLWKAVRRLEHLLVPKRFRGFVAHALQLLGLGFLFGGNVQAVGSWLLLRDRSAVWEFVKDAVRFGGSQDICQLAAYQFDVAVYVFEPVMQKLIGVTEWVCSHEGHTLPSATANTPAYAAAWAPSATPPIESPYTPKRLAPSVPLPRGVIEA